MNGTWLGSLKRLGPEVMTAVLVRVWSRLAPPTQITTAPSLAPSDNVQQAMNLIMPLHVPNIAARSRLTKVLHEAADEVLVGLNNVGTVHFARFDIIAGNLCMFSIYDGELSSYIRDFIASIGDVFDGIVAHVRNPPPTPVALHVDEFIAWIRAHDAFQMADSPTDLKTKNLSTMQRDTIVALHRNPNVQLGLYRAYPGFSAAQIREELSIGW